MSVQICADMEVHGKPGLEPSKVRVVRDGPLLPTGVPDHLYVAGRVTVYVNFY